MAISGGGISALFYTGPITPGDVASWLVPGVLQDGGGGGGGGMTIGGAVVGGTPGSVLFIGAGGILAQDNANFFWDDTHFSLNLNNIPALYRVPNVSGDNWFEAGAGNFTLTGYQNFGTGGGALASLTTGVQNVAIGENASNATTTGNGNFAVGTSALKNNLDGSNNTAIGIQALGFLNLSGGGSSNNAALGLQAGGQLQNGEANVFIGTQAGLSAVNNFIGNVVIGRQTGSSITSITNNSVYIGNATFDSGLGGNNSTIVGCFSMRNVTGTATGVTVLGQWAGPSTGNLSDLIALTDGGNASNQPALDWNYTNSNVWSFKRTTNPQGLHVYNTWDDTVPTSNYERGILDWNTTANVFTIGTPSSSAGGTGTIRETRLYTLGLPAIYIVPNGSGNNWFEGNAGNLTLSGYQNFGTGDGALSSLTTGFQNTATGTNTAQHLTDGNNNFTFGVNAMQNSVHDSFNTFMGFNCGATLGTGGAGGGGNTGNFAAGFAAFNNALTGFNNVAIGFTALSNAVASANQNVIIGGGAGNLLGFPAGNVNLNTLIGCDAGINLSGASSGNTWIGPFGGGTGGVISNTIALSAGGTAVNNTSLLDYSLTTAHVWSISYSSNLAAPAGLHLYNAQTLGPLDTTNYERAVLDWNITANHFTIGVPPSGAGGTGTLRDVYYYTAGLKAIFRVPNGAGDNWFEGNAGNLTVTGASNFGTGSSTLASLTSGTSNVGIGASACSFVTSGNGNLGIGTNACGGNTGVGNNNTGIGSFALQVCDGNSNTGIGSTALQHTSTGTSNIGIGPNAGSAITSGSSNICIGVNCLKSVTTNVVNVGIGEQVFQSVDANANLGIGYLVGHNFTAGQFNTIIGTFAGQNILSGSYNTILGCWDGPTAAMSNVIAFCDGTEPTLPQVDWNYTTSNVWSYQLHTTAQGLHVYNTADTSVPHTNYERFCLDWNLTSNVARFASQAGGTGTVRMIAIDAFQKAGAPAAGDLPSGTWGVINDTSGGNTWVVYNNAGTIRKVQLT